MTKGIENVIQDTGFANINAEVNIDDLLTMYCQPCGTSKSVNLQGYNCSLYLHDLDVWGPTITNIEKLMSNVTEKSINKVLYNMT